MSYKLVGYFENWAQYRPGKGKFKPDKDNIDPSLFTNINFAFAFFGYDRTKDPSRLTGDYKVYQVEWNDQSDLYPALQGLKTGAPGLKTSLSIGGWGFNDCTGDYGKLTCHLFSEMVGDSGHRQEFIDSAIHYAKQYGFDGIDLDWEYPGDTTRGGDPKKDFDNFTLLLREFQDRKSGLLLTMTPAAVAKGKPTLEEYCSWLATGCAPHLDWFNVMCYDYHGAFDMITGANAPLTHDSVPTGTWCVANTIEGYLKAGVPAGKIVLGMPTYGRTFAGVQGEGFNQKCDGGGAPGPYTGTSGFLAYYEIQDKIEEKELTRTTWDDTTKTPYADNRPKKDFVSYDDEKSLGLKTDYLVEKGLAGAMVWSIAEDHFQDKKYPLVRAIKRHLSVKQQ